MLEQFAEVFRLNTDYETVEMAHMEIAEPSILQAVTKCAESGAETIVIAPYFLSRYALVARQSPAVVPQRHRVVILTASLLDA